MRIAVLGSGVVGEALGTGLSRPGHDTVLGTGSPDREDLVAGAAETGWPVATSAAARELEAMCLAWVRYGARTGTWEHAFRLLRP